MQDTDPSSTTPGTTTRRVGNGETHVVQNGRGWQVRQTGKAGAGRCYASKGEAIAAAFRLTRPKGGRIVIHGAAGPMREGLILGRLAFDKVSAVEGLRLTAAMKRDLRALDGTAGSGDERRRVLIEKYGRGCEP